MPEQFIDLEVHGIQLATKNLRTLEQKARRRVVTAAARAGANVLKKEARQRAPRHKGRLRKNIRSSVRRNKATGTVTAKITPKATKKQKQAGQEAWYAHIVIGGAKSHTIPSAKKRRAGRYVRTPYGVFRAVQHPGIAANPFLEQAARAGYRPSVSAFENKFGQKMEQEMAKLRTEPPR